MGRPLNLAEEVCVHLGAWFARMARGKFFRRCRQHGVIATDLRLALDESHQLKDSCGHGTADVVEHIDIQRRPVIAMTNRHQGLKRSSAHQVGATHALHFVNAALFEDERIPVSRIFGGTGTRLHTCERPWCYSRSRTTGFAIGSSTLWIRCVARTRSSATSYKCGNKEEQYEEADTEKQAFSIR